MASEDLPKQPDTRSDRREKANRIAAISHRISDIGRQISGSLDGLRDQLLSLVEDVQANNKTTDTRDNKNHQDSLREVKRSTNWTIGLTVMSLVLTGLTLWILYNQLYAMRVDQRAWIKIETEIEPFEVNKPLTAKFTITNAGKTPAKRIEQSYSVQRVFRDQSPDLLTREATAFAGLLVPNGHFAVTVRRQRDKPDPFSPPLLTKIEIDEILSGKAYIAFIASINYFDIYETSHFINVCVWSAFNRGSYKSQECVEYNNIDNN